MWGTWESPPCATHSRRPVLAGYEPVEWYEMGSDRILQSAFQSLANARREFVRGEASPSICDAIGTSMCWAMEYWLHSQNKHPGHGGGWGLVCARFGEEAHGQPIYELASCLNKAESPENRIYGWPECEEPNHVPKPFDRETWRRDVTECVETAGRLLDTLSAVA